MALEQIPLIIASGLLLLIVLFFLSTKKRRSEINVPNAAITHSILEQAVPFYIRLDNAGREKFVSLLLNILSNIKITGVNSEVDDIDRVLIGAGAVIPVFYIPGWKYGNLNEVLLYPGSFNHEFMQEGYGRSISGMVGTGALEKVMVLSRPDLRNAFSPFTGRKNSVIHEFVHLIDKADGVIDGIPETLISPAEILSWKQLMQNEMALIRDERSEIDYYGGGYESEFFAVVSEYFFEQPEMLLNYHPELYRFLQKIFHCPDTGSAGNSVSATG